MNRIRRVVRPFTRIAPALRRSAAPVARLWTPARGVLTRFGWTTFVLGVVCWAVAWRLGWVEFACVSVMCISASVAGALFTLGRGRVQMALELDPTRVVAGSPAAGRLVATNAGPRRALPSRVELPIGGGVASFVVPSLAPGADHDEIFIIPTERRQVIPIGPASAVRSDPLGLSRRELSTTPGLELFVHPRLVALESLGSGFLRDLEGATTNDISMSDLAFHALRDYVPGDDRRYVHWRSSAKAGRLLVRQFLDTRRSHLTVVVDGARSSYASEDELELAISAGGSIAVRALRDEQDCTVLACNHATSDSSSQRVLDTLSRAEWSDNGADIAHLAARAARIAPETSIALLVSGSTLDGAALRAAGARFGPSVQVVALTCCDEGESGITVLSGMTIVRLSRLRDLPRLLRAMVNS
ncbi:MAG: hypothetical protein JWM93_3326 [Frankiales bacterium]|nr:hypothetical protein [Frankiales bacterium]